MSDTSRLTEEERIAKAVAAMRKPRLITTKGAATILSVVAGMLAASLVLAVLALLLDAQARGTVHHAHPLRGSLRLVVLAGAAAVGTSYSLHRSFERVEGTGDADPWVKKTGAVLAVVLIVLGALVAMR